MNGKVRIEQRGDRWSVFVDGHCIDNILSRISIDREAGSHPVVTLDLLVDVEIVNEFEAEVFTRLVEVNKNDDNRTD